MNKKLTPLNFKTPGREFKTWFTEHFSETYVDEGEIFILTLPFSLRDGDKARAYVFKTEGRRTYTVSDGGGILRDLAEAMAVKSDDDRPILKLKKDALAELGRKYGLVLMENDCFVAVSSHRNQAVASLAQFWMAVDGIARMWFSAGAAISKAVTAAEKKQKGMVQ